MQKQAYFRFYAELNDFLSAGHRYHLFGYSFKGTPAIKDCIEALGVPHTEVDLILVNGASVGFDCKLQNGDYVSVYPVFESVDVSQVTRLRAKPLRDPRFIADVHLGKLARKLRMLGFDILYRNDYDDIEIIDLSLTDRRIILTRDRGILMNKSVTHGYWIRADHVYDQLTEVLNRFDLFAQVTAFRRCLVCNGVLTQVDKEAIKARLLPKTDLYYDEFHVCCECGRFYWKGSHYREMKIYIENLLKHQRQ